jgi:hypothetical protein
MTEIYLCLDNMKKFKGKFGKEELHYEKYYETINNQNNNCKISCQQYF